MWVAESTITARLSDGADSMILFVVVSALGFSNILCPRPRPCIVLRRRRSVALYGQWRGVQPTVSLAVFNRRQRVRGNLAIFNYLLAFLGLASSARSIPLVVYMVTRSGRFSDTSKLNILTPSVAHPPPLTISIPCSCCCNVSRK